MLLRSVALLLLCVSVARCATLVQYQTPANEEEAPAVADAAVAAEVPANDSPAAEEPAADTLLSNNQSTNITGVDNTVADEQEVDVSATADKTETNSDGPNGDLLVLEAITGEDVSQKQPSASSVEEGNDIRPVQTHQPLNRPLAQADSSWSLNSIRNSFQTVHGYFDSLVELVGGHNGVCQYRCRYGEHPQPRPGYQLKEPDGCASSLVGFQVPASLDLGIPAMTKCCNQLDVCYETCGTNKYDCDSEFRSCLHGLCSDINRSLGFVSQVQACGSMADTLYNTVWTLGCRSYMNSQRAACICEGEERDEL